MFPTHCHNEETPPLRPDQPRRGFVGLAPGFNLTYDDPSHFNP